MKTAVRFLSGIARCPHQAFQATEAWMARNGVSPNTASLLSLGYAVAAAESLYATSFLEPPAQRLSWLGTAVFIQLRWWATLLQECLPARKARVTAVRPLYQEMTNRISDTVILIACGFAAGGTPALGYFAACAALLTAFARILGKSLGVPNECGPMAGKHRMMLLTAVSAYCGLAPATWHLQVEALPSWGLASYALAVVVLLGVYTMFRRLKKTASQLKKPAPA